MESPFRDSNNLDLLRAHQEVLKRENALLRRENKSLQRPTSEALTELVKTLGTPILQVSLVVAAITTGNLWFAAILLFTL
jgi:hypothetical protein